MLRRSLGMGLALAMLPATMFAADPQLEAARQCTQLKDSLQRLVCYDKALAESPPVVAVVPPVPASPVASIARPSPAPTPAVPAAPVAPAVAPGAAPAAHATPPALGDESLKHGRKERGDEPASLEAKVTASRAVRQDTWRVWLDNGQIWQQLDMSASFRVEVGDTVRIEKGVMGGYRMARINNGRSGWVRVSRLQ